MNNFELRVHGLLCEMIITALNESDISNALKYENILIHSNQAAFWAGATISSLHCELVCSLCLLQS